MKAYVLSGYPLSLAYLRKLEAAAGCALVPVKLVELRQRGLVAMLRTLRGLKGSRVYIAYEEPSSKAVLPVMKIAAACMPTPERYEADEEARLSPVSLGQVAASIFGLISASAVGLASTGVSMLRAFALRNQPRAESRARGRRVLYLNANLWFGIKAGGSVGHVSGVVNGFSEEGYDVLFCSAGGRLLVKKAIPYEPLQAPRSFGMPWEANYYVFDDLVVKQLGVHAAAFKPSFLYQRMSLANYSGVRLSRKLGVPLVIEYNGSEVWIARHWGNPLRLETAAQLAEDACLKHAQLIVTVSDALGDELRERGIEKSRIVVYPNCIDPGMFDPGRFSSTETAALRRHYAIEEDATVVTFLGSFGQWHGVPVLAEVIRRMIESERDCLDRYKVRFLLIGDGVKMPEVRQILGNHADGPYVRFAGLVQQDAAPLHLAASDILSSPHVPNADGSRFFGSPTKLFEYMAMGKGIVASALDQIGDVLADSLRASTLPQSTTPAGSALAVLAKPGDVLEHMVAIKFLVQQPVWRAHLGVNARAEALERYTWAKHVSHIADALYAEGNRD